jgi:hypothetical protein
VELDHDVHLGADRLPDLAERLHRGLELAGGDVEAAPALGREVEGPDLHRRNALLEQRVRELVGAVQEGVEVLVRAFLAVETPILGELALGAAYVAVAGAGVVGPDLRPRETAQELVDRPAGRLAEQVPERDVDRRGAAQLGPARGEAQIIVVEEGAGVAVDLERVLAEQARCRGLVDVGLDGARSEEGLTQAHEPLVGVDLDPEEVRELLEPDRLDRADPHRRCLLPCAGRPSSTSA